MDTEEQRLSEDHLKTNTWTIELDEVEKVLLGKIELDAHALKGFDHNQENGKHVVALMERLKKRKAIPTHRLQWFTDPECNIGGRGSSYLEIFERNLHGTNDVRLHPHFLAHLRYFIYGPDLPEAVMEAFVAAVKECGQVTSSDVLPLAREAKTLARNHQLDKNKAAEEFFKLARECGLSVSTATMIRKDVTSIR